MHNNPNPIRELAEQAERWSKRFNSLARLTLSRDLSQKDQSDARTMLLEMYPLRDEIVAEIRRAASSYATEVAAQLELAATKFTTGYDGVPALLSEAIAMLNGVAKKADKADTKTDKQKIILPPHEVNDCARYIVEQRELIARGKRPKATKTALIAEHLGHDDTEAMERQLRPSRFGWLLTIGQKTDK